MKQGATFLSAFNAHESDLVQLARMHCLFTCVYHNATGVLNLRQTTPSSASTSSSTSSTSSPASRFHHPGAPATVVLGKLCALFALYHVQAHAGLFLLAGSLQANFARKVPELIKQLLVEIRPDAVPLVDAYGLSVSAC